MATCKISSNFTCPKDVSETQSAKDFCNQAMAKYKELKNDKSFVEGLTDFLVPIKGIIKSFGTNSDTGNTILNKLGINISSTQRSEINNRCIVNTAASQTNSINIDQTECVNLAYKVIKELPEKDRAQALRDYQNSAKIKIKDITQENKITNISDCIANANLDFLLKETSGITNDAIQKIVADIQGSLVGSDVDQFMCNEINSNLSACQYAQQNNCCYSKLTTNQQNIFNLKSTCGDVLGENINQKNDFASYQSCNLTAQSGMSSDIASSIINRNTQESTVKVTGLTLDFLVAFFIMVALIVLSPVVLVGTMGNKIFTMIGIILIIISIVMFILYFTTGKEIIRLNDPEVVNKGKTDKDIKKSVSFRQAKEIAMDKSAIGFDFIAEGKKTEINDDTMGFVILITELGKAEDRNVSDLGDISTKTVIFAKSIYLYIGIGLLIAGVLQITLGILKKDKKKDDSTGINTSVSSSAESK
jgi:hypothetical protein